MRTRILRFLSVIAGIAICAMLVFAHHIDHANVTANCTGYTIQVDGSELDVPGATYAVNYTIVLTPVSGPPITINGSIPVSPDASQNFYAVEAKAWSEFGVTLNGTYSLSGTATLFTNGVAQNQIPVGFATSSLTCPGTCSGSIGDFVWNDLNHNGIQDSGEPPMAVVVVQLWNSTMTSLIASGATDVNGLYHFNGLCAGTYNVVIPVQPSGFLSSPTLQGPDMGKDSNPNPFTVFLPNNSVDNTIDFGYYIPTPHITITKNPKNGTFTAGSQVSFTMVVGNDGGAPATNVKLHDQLPGNGGLLWTGYTTTQGVCTLSMSNVLDCDFGTIAPSASVTVTVTSADPTPIEACQPQPNPHAIATADGGLQVEDSGMLSCGKTFTIGPSSMEGAIQISNGDWVNGGYSFKFVNGGHLATNFSVSATVTISGPCSNGGTDTVIVPLGNVTYPVPAGNTDWLPTGDQNSVLSWQGSVRVGVNSPSVCGGVGKLNASKGAVYTATVAQNPPSGSLVNFRFKFRDPAAKGKPNTNCLDTSDPNRNKADVCGASWSQTVRDP